MKGLSHIFIVLLSFIAFSCVNVMDDVDKHDDEVQVTFTLVNHDLSTKGEAGIEDSVDNNESLITKADIFLYADETENAVCKLTWTGLNSTKTTTLSSSLSTDVVTALFGTGATSGTCHAYAIVNGPDTPEVADGSDTKISTLKALEIGAEGCFSSFPIASFVMDGENEVSYSNDKVTGNINLYRAASKIQLYLADLKNYTDDAGNVWVPQTSGLSVSLINGVHKSRIDVQTNDLTDGNYFSVTAREFDYSTKTHNPFYSYPSDWGRSSEPDEESYLTLRIYWAKAALNNGELQYGSDGTVLLQDGTTEAYYYRVPINLEGAVDDNGEVVYESKKLERNTWYKINLEVGVLGDKAENSKVELTPKYVVIPWNPVDLEASLSEYHYLVVDKNYVEMLNAETVTIGFRACSDVTVEIVRMLRPDFSDEQIDTTYFYGSYVSSNNPNGYGDGTAYVGTVSGLINNCSVSVDNTSNTFTLTHQLQNDMSETPYDYAIYTIVVRVSTSDGCGLYQDVVIDQYPSKYIQGDYTTYNNGSHGTVWVNGYGGPGADGGSSWYNVENTLEGSSENSNPNSYVITVTSFDGDDIYDSTGNTGYIIADPRDRAQYYSDDDLGYTSVPAPAIGESSDRQLEYYYTTLGSLEDASSLNENDYRMRLIAPKFRVATAYGRKGSGEISTRTNAVKRCSSYQEYGRPAGRWRVPTPAELDYISRLCNDDVIPWLFKSGGRGGYTSSFGSWTTSGVTISDDITSVRCVYDEWYWGDSTCDPTVYTWGDAVIN